MAGEKDVDLSVGVDAAGLLAGMQKAAAAVKQASTQMQASMQGVSNTFKTVQTAFLGFTAVLAGGAAFKSMINASNEWAGQQTQLSKALGISTEKASVMSVAMNHLGIGSDTVISASQKLSKQIFSNSEAFETMGVKVKDSAGNYRPVVDVMAEVNAQLVAIKNPIEQNIAGMQVYGKGWTEIRSILKLTQTEMDRAEQRARELGLIVGPEGAAKAKQYKEQMADLNLVSKSLEIQFGNALLPVFVRTGKFMSEEGPAAGKAFGTCIEAIGFAASATWLALKDMGDGIGALAAQSAALLSGDLAGFKAIGKARDEEAAKNEAAYERLKAGFGKELPKASSGAPVPQDAGPHYDFSSDGDGNKRGSKGKADHGKMGEYESLLAEQKLIYAQEHEGREMRSEDEKKFWENILATQKVAKADKLTIARKIAEDDLSTLRENTRNKLALTREEIEEEERLRLSLLATDEENAQQQLALGQITKSQLLAQQKVFEDQRYQIQKEAQSKRIALMRQEDDPAAYAAANEKLLELDRAKNLKKLQLDNQLAQQESPLWKGMTSSMSSLWDKGINAMMNGTLRWENALRATWTEMAGMFADVMIKPIVANWAKSLSTMIAQKLGFAAQSKTADTTSAITAASAEKVKAAAVIPSEAAVAAGAAASSVAGIPIIGPGLAEAAYAKTMAMVLGGLAVASASGGYDIPSGINPVTQLHQEEMVLPAKYANAIRGMTEGGGGGGGDVHYHDYSGRLTKSQIRENAAVIATELNRLHRDGWRPK